MRLQDLTRAHAPDASLSCGHFDVDVTAPAGGGWKFLRLPQHANKSIDEL